VADPQRLDPSLLAAGQGDEESQFDQFRFGEVGMEVRPESVVGEVRVPDDGAGIAQRGLLPVGEAIGVLELQEIVVVGFGEALPSSLDGSLDASIVTGDRLRHVYTAKLLDLVVEHAVEKRRPPCLGEGVEHRGNVTTDRLALRPGCAVDPAVFDDLAVARVE
jgi:hypothetical protein